MKIQATTFRQVRSSLGGFSVARVVLPGVLAIQSPRFTSDSSRVDAARFCNQFVGDREAKLFPLITLVDDAAFAVADLNNWLWVTFTRSNPAIDLERIDSVFVIRGNP